MKNWIAGWTPFRSHSTARVAFLTSLLFQLTVSIATATDSTISGETVIGETGVSLTVGEIMTREQSAAKSGVTKPAGIIPFRTIPSRRESRQNPASPTAPDIQSSSQSAIAQPELAPQTIGGVNFTGATFADTNVIPPDSMGAAGPTQFIVAINGRIRSFNKSTGVADGVLNSDPDNFFAPVKSTQSGTFTFNPRIRYDRLSGRWFITTADIPGGTGTIPNRVLIAVSNSDTITVGSTWTFFYYQYTGSNFFDYPTLGIDQNALYIGTNVFSTTGFAFIGSDGLVVRKSSILGAGPIVVTRFANLATANGAGPYTPQGVDNFDPTASEGYFIGVDTLAFSTLMLRRVSNPGGTPTISGNVSISVPTTSYPITVPHLGDTGGINGKLEALDDRLFSTAMRNGRLWTAHNISVTTAGVGSSSGTRNGSRWYELQGIATGQTPSLVQSGTIFDSTATNPRFYWIPSVTVSGQGHAAMGFSTAGAAEYINAGTVGRLAGDPLGTMGTPLLYTSSSTAYNPPSDTGASNGSRRWGGYSYTSVDPDDDMTMWTIQEYCNDTNSYGVQVVKLIAPPPATPSAALPATIPANQPSVNVTITGTSVSGSGFFDPGSGFLHRISAAVSGGVTVNSVTYTDPTHITLNISTVGTTPGIQTVTVTNPDGQNLTSGGIITISPQLYSLEVGFGGNGGGTVTITNQGNQTVCNTACSSQLPGGSEVSLHAGPDQYSIFSGWSGACTKLTDCVFTLNGPSQATANLTIDAAHSVRIKSNYYPELYEAYKAAAPEGVTIEAWGITFPQVLPFDLIKDITLTGGFDSTYSSSKGMSTILYPLIVRNGSLRVQKLSIIK